MRAGPPDGAGAEGGRQPRRMDAVRHHGRSREAGLHAVVIDDGRLSWRERPDPEPARGELLVAVRAAGVNGADLAQLAGRYPPPEGVVADVPGLELAGEVVGTGRGVTRFAVGERVMGLTAGGAQASVVPLDERHALPLPEGLSWAEGGGFPEAFATAYDALFSQAKLACGERLLVTGAAGGVGTAAVQLAAVAGADVVACVRRLGARDELTALGAAEVITPAEIGMRGPYDVVLELVGAPTLRPAVGALALRGRVVVIGVGGGSVLQLELLELMSRRAQLRASTLRARSAEEKATLIDGLRREVLPLLAAGRVHVPVFATFPMQVAQAAYDRFALSGKLGKIVLLP